MADNADNETIELLNLSDQLAVDRTRLGNLRTMLASIRTSITLFGLGITLIKLFTHNLLIGIGHLAIISSVLVFIGGTGEYIMYRKYLNRISRKHAHLYE